MTVRRLIVLSGISTRVADKIGPSLRSMGGDVAFVKIGSDGLTSDYFDRLVDRTLSLAGRASQSLSSKIFGLLVSAVPSGSESLEADYFFPAMRRIGVPPEYRNDPNRAQALVRLIMQAFASDIYQTVAKVVAPQEDERLLLPVRNSGVDRLERQFREIYHMRQTGFTRRLTREVVRMKKGRGLRMRGLDFKSAVNNGTHPIRRCTGTPTCDLKALLRFGVSVVDRFEFDVSCESGLNGKTFYLCDGTPVRISASPSHLNMRLNDDFMAA
ncbi:hypothetical protein ACFSCW_16610 [Sphingomonas tabacisoli]|uniref:Uncharacterized protein n=1 Tax=Sphingomonas tabacisoli TaxID=2249466 RepID=A0ABW4I631_9SPHN